MSSSDSKIEVYMEEIQQAGSFPDVQTECYEVKVKIACIINCLCHGCDTWPMRGELESIMERTEMRIIRWMCGVTWEKSVQHKLRRYIYDITRRYSLRGREILKAKPN